MSMGALLDMPPKKKVAGRPKTPIPLRSLVSLKGTAEFEAWVDVVVEATESGNRTNMLKRAMKLFAQTHKVAEPMPKR